MSRLICDQCSRSTDIDDGTGVYYEAVSDLPCLWLCCGFGPGDPESDQGDGGDGTDQ